MKAYTDLSQSKKLVEILPIETADMRYVPFGDNYPWVWNEEVKLLEKDSTPCWSLAALLDILPKVYRLKPIIDLEENSILYSGTNFDVRADNIIDACVDMILLLKEKNLI